MDELDIAQLIAEAAYREGGVAGLSASTTEENPTLRFFDNLRRAALESMDRAEGAGASPTVFVLSERSARQDARSVNAAASRIVDINLRNPSDWEGKLIFTAPHGTSGWSIVLPEGSVDSAIDLLESAGFGHLPIAIIYPEQRALSCYHEGGISEVAPINLHLPAQSRTVTIKDIFDVLEDIRRNSLLTPQVGPPGFWADGPGYEPGAEAERHIQWVVAAQLKSNFRPLLVDTEQIIPLGRIDIVITNPSPTNESPLYPAVIELKALKSKSNGGAAFSETKNVRAVLKGMRQAKSYREVKQAKYSVLGCFDMRKDKNDILNLGLCVMARQRYFQDDRVDAFVFPLYGSSEDAQEEFAAAEAGVN
ncbi:hypothetical protein [Pelagibacterium sp.]|jgi:hypothetical protein|uniref:hypothetical protein n=1 Tax=Pelagibacterium sp. TaxID=1967288 RepID=UPI003BAB8560